MFVVGLTLLVFFFLFILLKFCIRVLIFVALVDGVSVIVLVVALLGAILLCWLGLLPLILLSSSTMSSSKSQRR